MSDPSALLALTGVAVAGLGLASGAALKAWSEWLELKRLELRGGRPLRRTATADLGELKDRVRRLEAIASGEA